MGGRGSKSGKQSKASGGGGAQQEDTYSRILREEQEREERIRRNEEERNAVDREIRDRWQDGNPEGIIEQLQSEQRQLDEFLEGKGSKYIEVNGEEFERMSVSEIKKWYLRDYVENFSNENFDFSNDTYDIVYKDGTYVRAGDVLARGGKIKMSEIASVIYTDGYMTHVAGVKGLRAESYLGSEITEFKKRLKSDRRVTANEEPNIDDHDWRIDFK